MAQQKTRVHDRPGAGVAGAGIECLDVQGPRHRAWVGPSGNRDDIWLCPPRAQCSTSVALQKCFLERDSSACRPEAAVSATKG